MKRLNEYILENKNILLEDYIIIDEYDNINGIIDEGLLDWFKKFWKKLFKSTDKNIKNNGGTFTLSNISKKNVSDLSLDIEEVPYKVFAQLMKKTKSEKEGGEFYNAFKYAKENKYDVKGNHIFSINKITKDKEPELIGFEFCKSKVDKNKKVTYVAPQETIFAKTIEDNKINIPGDKVKNALMKTIKEKHKGAKYIDNLDDLEDKDNKKNKEKEENTNKDENTKETNKENSSEDSDKKEDDKNSTEELIKDIEKGTIHLSKYDYHIEKMINKFTKDNKLNDASKYFEKKKKYYTLSDQEDFSYKETRNVPSIFKITLNDSDDCIGVLFCSVKTEIKEKEIIPVEISLNHLSLVDNLMDNGKIKLPKKMIEQKIFGSVEKVQIPHYLDKECKMVIGLELEKQLEK